MKLHFWLPTTCPGFFNRGIFLFSNSCWKVKWKTYKRDQPFSLQYTSQIIFLSCQIRNKHQFTYSTLKHWENWERGFWILEFFVLHTIRNIFLGQSGIWKKLVCYLPEKNIWRRNHLFRHNCSVVAFYYWENKTLIIVGEKKISLDSVLLCAPGWPWTCGNPPASVHWDYRYEPSHWAL